MDTDLTLVDDLSTGLRAHLYLLENKELRNKGWNG